MTRKGNGNTSARRRNYLRKGRHSVTPENLQLVEMAMMKKALSGDYKAMRFVLCNRLPKHWKVESVSHKSIAEGDVRAVIKVITDDIKGQSNAV